MILNDFQLLPIVQCNVVRMYNAWFYMNFPVTVGLAQSRSVGDISQSHADTDCRH